MVEPWVLQIERVSAPSSAACLTAISVSIVSPDWLIDTTRVRSSTIGSQYRNSCASETSTGMRVQCSMAYFATIPA